MNLIKLIIYITIFLFVLLFILFPEFRTLMLGWTRIFIKDMATTPEGAEAIYAEKINEAQDKYNKADDALRLAAGKLDNETKELEILEKRLKDVESKCETLVKAGKMDAAIIKSEERNEILSDIDRRKQLITAYTNAKNDAMEVHKACEANLRKLKRESREVVENMKVKAQLSEVYDSMDELKNVSSSDRLVNQIREKNNDLNASVSGARVIYENKTSTKIQRADEQAKKLQSDDYLESLKKKYSK